jgi:aldehyde:ferredoxin oxidoreductase
MRKFLHINLNDRTIEIEEMAGEALARAGRHYIVRTLLAAGVAKVDPLSRENPLIFSAGPFAGTNFSNANRLSVGCKSPLTGGIKEANSGGTFAFALGQIELAGLTLYGATDDWVVIRIPKKGEITFEDAAPYMGKGNIEAAALLHERYGDKVSLAICGPVGEYQGLMAGIAFTDPEGRPVRLAARGGVGAVMGAKKVKAIVVDKHKMPTFHDRRKVMGSVKGYNAKLAAEPAIENYTKLGTAMMADVMNHVGGIPVRNFSSGQLVDTDVETMKMGGQHIRGRNLERGGDTEHACMPGCMIKCSNIYVDEDGNEVVSPLEYETIGLMGTNCGLDDPDDLARLNFIANDLGIDTIEAGAMLAVLMEAGQADYGDVAFMEAALDDIRKGNARGRLLARGTAHVGEHYQARRVPVIKKQAISAYDPRIIEVTAISMMVTAQGADHTVGNLPVYECAGKDTEHLTAVSMDMQTNSAAADSLGICIFGRAVTNINHAFMVDAINNALGTELPTEFFAQLGRETLEMEAQFNEEAGFTAEDDELPAFFRTEELPPSGKTARHRVDDIHRFRSAWLEERAG